MNIKIKKEPKYKVIKTEVPIDTTKIILEYPILFNKFN